MKILLMLLTLCSLVINPQALSFSGLYSDIASGNSTAENLLLYAYNLDPNIVNQEYVIFCPERYNYYLVWGDLTLNGTDISGTDIQFVSYIRDDSMIYSYSYGTDTTFSLTGINYLVTSNLPVGIGSPIYVDFVYQKNMINLAIFSVACVSGLFILILRKE